MVATQGNTRQKCSEGEEQVLGMIRMMMVNVAKPQKLHSTSARACVRGGVVAQLDRLLIAAHSVAQPWWRKGMLSGVTRHLMAGASARAANAAAPALPVCCCWPLTKRAGGGGRCCSEGVWLYCCRQACAGQWLGCRRAPVRLGSKK